MTELYNKCNISGTHLYSPWVLLPNEFVPNLQRTLGMVVSLRSTDSPAITLALKMQICSNVIDLSYPWETLGECRILHPAEMRCAGIHIHTHPPQIFAHYPRLPPVSYVPTHVVLQFSIQFWITFLPHLTVTHSCRLPTIPQATSELQVFCKVKCYPYCSIYEFHYHLCKYKM